MEKRPRLPRRVAIALASVSALLAGCVIALLILWLARRDASPTFLSDEYRENYARLVNAAFVCDRDVEKAQTRLELLGVPNAAQRAAELATSYDHAGTEWCDPDGSTVHATGTPPAATASTTGMVGTPGPPPTGGLAPASAVTAGPTGTDPPTVMLTAPPSATPARPQPSDAAGQSTSVPEPSNTPNTAITSQPDPTATPEPTVVEWTWTERLVSVGEDGQYCGEGYLRIRVMALDPYDNQIPDVWIYDRYSKIFQATGNVDAPDWGPGETMFNYGGDGGGALCIAQGQGGTCLTGYTRDMPCFNPPPFEDMWAAGWCQCCGTEAAGDKELCQEMHERGDRCMNWGHYAWRVVYRRSW